jgi:hypothetical protein
MQHSDVLKFSLLEGPLLHRTELAAIKGTWLLAERKSVEWIEEL